MHMNLATALAKRFRTNQSSTQQVGSLRGNSFTVPVNFFYRFHSTKNQICNIVNVQKKTLPHRILWYGKILPKNSGTVNIKNIESQKSNRTESEKSTV